MPSVYPLRKSALSDVKMKSKSKSATCPTDLPQSRTDHGQGRPRSTAPPPDEAYYGILQDTVASTRPQISSGT
ncbi:hypothetical protein N7535_007514 [Penicillium sp. DV-2018c]|nr:hypothetical protein N7461_003539 [Penicillium sp. DV-2018c]KAJ5565876.1 hypothetical protein N7535_007514 [Penicillium sp. DV-2018c]